MLESYSEQRFSAETIIPRHVPAVATGTGVEVGFGVAVGAGVGSGVAMAVAVAVGVRVGVGCKAALPKRAKRLVRVAIPKGLWV